MPYTNYLYSNHGVDEEYAKEYESTESESAERISIRGARFKDWVTFKCRV